MDYLVLRIIADKGSEFPYKKKGTENCPWFGAIQRKFYNLSTVDYHDKELGGGGNSKGKGKGRMGGAGDPIGTAS